MGLLRHLTARLRWLVCRLPDRVEVDPTAVHGYCGDLRVWTVRWEDMEDVLVETTDRGPQEDNCFLILGSRTAEFRIPSETPGFPNVVSALAGCLDGIDDRALIESMGCQDNREFIIWERTANT